VSLQDIKPYLNEPELAGLVQARDILRDDFPRLAPEQTFTDALAGFLNVTAERLPVVDQGGQLRGSLAKSDLLLALAERRKKPGPR
jgi:CIC family chloride channel protein